MIPDDVVDQIKAAADMVGIIGESVSLKRTGADWRGPCPFHGGKNRNFAVVPRNQFFYCFVCHEKGDIFSYLMKRFGMDYPTAIREVARRTGIIVPEERERAGPDPHAPFLTAVSVAHEWFRAQLAEPRTGHVARDYLAARGFDAAAIEAVEPGFAPRGPGLQEELARQGLDDATAIEAGLLILKDDGAVYPRFRERLMLPIRDLRGRVVAFGGRILGDGEPKYLNSPESPIFHKGRMLYNLHAAKQSIRQAEEAILVEGYFDVLGLELGGVRSAVAPLGTSLTQEQAGLLRRYTGAVVILYDSDEAGRRATFRAADELLRQGVRVRVATMPAGEDPDTMMRGQGRAAVDAVIAEATDVLETKLELLHAKGWFSDVSHRRRALDRLLPTLRAAADPITQQLYLSKVAERLGVSKQVLEGEVRLQASSQSRRETAPTQPKLPSGLEGRSAATTMLELMMISPEHRVRASEDVTPEHFTSRAQHELFLALGTRAPAEGDQMPDGVSHEAELAWQELRARAETRQGSDLSASYEGALEMLLAESDWEQIERIEDPLSRKQARDALRSRYPNAVKSLELQRTLRRRAY